MKLVAPETPDYVDEPFTAENDLFGLSGYAEQLSQFIENSPTPMTMVLHGGWGTGKTVFARQWHATLQYDDRESIYFDCYSNDYHEDPLLPLSAAILARFASDNDSNDDAINSFKERAVAAARATLPVGAKVAASWATAGLVSSDQIDDIVEQSRGTSEPRRGDSNPTDSALLEQLHGEMSGDSPREGFQRALARLVESRKETDGDSSGPPLVLILDELDRCRPDFALRLLERVKHFFSVPGVCFFFVSNLDELRGIVSHEYGLTDTARTYLEKFFDVRTTFPAPKQGSAWNSHYQMMQYLRKHLRIPSQNNNLLSDTFDCAVILCSVNDLSLRTFQRIASHIALYFRAAGHDIAPPATIAGMAILKQTDAGMYRSATHGTITWGQAKHALGLEVLDLEDPGNEQIVDWWKYATDQRENLEDDKKQAFDRMTRGSSLRLPESIPEKVGRTMDSFATFESY